MTTKTLQARICNKRDTETNWEQSNPILLNGEIIIVYTVDGQIRTKTGDGQKRYNELPFNDEQIKSFMDKMIVLYAGDYPLYGTSFADVDDEGCAYIRESGDGDYLISVSFSGNVLAKRIGI